MEEALLHHQRVKPASLDIIDGGSAPPSSACQARLTRPGPFHTACHWHCLTRYRCPPWRCSEALPHHQTRPIIIKRAGYSAKRAPLAPCHPPPCPRAPRAALGIRPSRPIQIPAFSWNRQRWRIVRRWRIARDGGSHRQPHHGPARFARPATGTAPAPAVLWEPPIFTPALVTPPGHAPWSRPLVTPPLVSFAALWRAPRGARHGDRRVAAAP